MRALGIITLLLMMGNSFAQNSLLTPEDSIARKQLINTIEQSLDLFYKEYSPEGNYDSIIDALNYEQDSVPSFSNEVYCERLNAMNEASPFHLDCNEYTLNTIKFFAKKRRGFARVVLGRSKLYFDMFEAKLTAHDLPIELKYLAVIESGLRPQVKSRAGALGLWQFMYGTGRMFGLKESSYIDERMDPEKATEAACKYLKKLYGIYDDWNLALAAYNAGPGNVNKAIRRSGNKLSYWEVRPFLPRETQGYVPNFIAAAYLLTHHAEHNIIPMEATIRYPQLDTICLNKGVHMASISELLSFELEEVKRLNPVYKKAYIPKTPNQQCISLPAIQIGQLVTLEDSLYRLEKMRYSVSTTTPPKTNGGTTAKTYTYHKVRSGETLGAIAAKYGVSVAEIQRINGLRSTKIYVGQRLKVKPGSVSTPKPRTTTSRKYYTVRSGDTFGAIAQRNRLSQSQLKRLNPRINISRLSIGQKIRVK
ncbi:MAG: transglycosylase SLT domain-containing protein [Crocinitomicaceae bacterium]|nr:transglycosylase SLT domain-containing protein [Crocinitomicaceae bacterium]